MEKITCLTDNNEPVVFFVLEQTRINGKNYLLVTDVEDENVGADAYILKDESQDSDSEASYVIVDDDDELEYVSQIFAELLDDVDIEK